MKYCFILLAFALMQTNAEAQTETTSLISSRLFELKNEVANLSTQNAALQEEIRSLQRELAHTKYNDDGLKKKLNEKTTELVLLQAQLNKTLSILQTVSDGLERSKTENAELVNSNKNFQNTVDSLQSLYNSSINFINNLQDTLKKYGQENLVLSAKATAYKQILDKLIEESNSKSTALVVGGGYKFTSFGWKFNASYGLCLLKDKVLFTGLGIGFEEYKEFEIKTIPLYITTRYVLTRDGNLTYPINDKGEQETANGMLYFIAEAGYSFLRDVNFNSQIEDAGIFFCTGFGILYTMNYTVSLDANVMFKHQNLINTEQVKFNSDVMCLNIGVFVNLKKF